MQALDLARKAYAAPGAPTRTARGTEYDLFARITHRLRAARTTGFPALVTALHDNRDLWNLLASDVAGDGNGLPKPLRVQLQGLATFTTQHTSKILAGDGSEDVLVEINTAVMRGLRADPAAPQTGG